MAQGCATTPSPVDDAWKAQLTTLQIRRLHRPRCHRGPLRGLVVPRPQGRKQSVSIFFPNDVTSHCLVAMLTCILTDSGDRLPS
jgi:hypothetical protein